MTSAPRINANRRNAAHSTGPSTNAGRQRSKFNAVKTGLYAKTTLLRHEDPTAYDELKVEIIEKYAPIDVIESTLAQSIIDDLWRLKRIRFMEDFCLQRVIVERMKENLAETSLAELNELHKDALTDRDSASADMVVEFIGGYRSYRVLTDDDSSSRDYAGPVPLPLDPTIRLNVALDTGDTLIETYVIEGNFMEQILRLRRQADRDLVHHIAALETIQERRNTLENRSKPKD